jgi:hypothetical protein
MNLKTRGLKKFSKVLSLLSNMAENYFYLDPKNKLCYLEANDTVAKISLEIEDVEDMPDFMVFNKNDFFHTISYADDLTLKQDGSYIMDEIKGKLVLNPKLVSMKDSYSSIFTSLDQDFFLFSIDTYEELLAFTDGSIYVSSDEDGNNLASRALHLIDDRIASSSMYRLYLSNFKAMSKSIALPSLATKIVSILGVDTEVFLKDKTFHITNNSIAISTPAFVNVNPLPINSSSFTNVMDKLRVSDYFELPLDETLPKLSWLSYYAKQNVNSLTHVQYDGKSLVFSVNENQCLITPNENFQKDNESSFNFYFDLTTFLEVLTRLPHGGTSIKLFETQEIKLVLIEVSSTVEVFLTKINFEKEA